MNGASMTTTKRKAKVGRVVSDKMDKTIVVSVERLTRHRLYKRVIRLTTKFKAHDGATGARASATPAERHQALRLVGDRERAGESAGEVIVSGEAATTGNQSPHPGRRTSAAAEEDGAS
jgi:hypothetical protein